VWAVLCIWSYFVDSILVDVDVEIDLSGRIHPFLLGAVGLRLGSFSKKKTKTACGHRKKKLVVTLILERH
jgi:hypothetical protein